MNKKILSLILAIIGTAAICIYIAMPRKVVSNTASNTTKNSTVNTNDNKKENDKNDSADVSPNAYTEKVSPTNTDSDKKTTSSLSLNEYIKSLKCRNYITKANDTISSISKEYTDKCNLSTVKNLISIINNKNVDEKLAEGTTLKIPEAAFASGTLHKVVANDTWYKIAKQYYKNYKVDDVKTFVSKVNNMSNDTLIKDTTIYLPSVQ